MPKTKAQKIKALEEGLSLLKKSKTVLIADFTGLSANEMNVLRKSLVALDAKFQVIKKRLLRIIFEKEKAEFDSKKFAGQMGVVFSPKDLVETAGAVYQFAKTKKNLFKFLGGFDVGEKKFMAGADVQRIGQLPGREVLLGQLVGMFAAPIRQFMFVLKGKAKKVEAK